MLRSLPSSFLLIVLLLAGLFTVQCVNPLLQDPDIGTIERLPTPADSSQSAFDSPLPPNAYSAPLEAPPLLYSYYFELVYPHSLEFLLSQAAIIATGEIGPIVREIEHEVYGDDGKLLIEGDEKQQAYARRVGFPSVDRVVTIHEVFRDDGRIASGEPVYLRVAKPPVLTPEQFASIPPEMQAIFERAEETEGLFLLLLSPTPDGAAYGLTYGPWGRLQIEEEALIFPETEEKMLIRGVGEVTQEILLDAAKTPAAQFVPRVYEPDPNVTPPWLIESDPIEEFKQSIVSQYLASNMSEEERAWRENWLAEGGEQILRELYDFHVYLIANEPNFLAMSSYTSFADNVPHGVNIRIQNMTAEEFTAKHLADKSWADLVEIEEYKE